MRLALAPKVAVAEADTAVVGADKVVAEADTAVAGADKVAAEADTAVTGVDKVVAEEDMAVTGVDKVAAVADKGAADENQRVAQLLIINFQRITPADPGAGRTPLPAAVCGQSRRVAKETVSACLCQRPGPGTGQSGRHFHR